MRVLHDLNTWLVVATLAALYLADAPLPFASVLKAAAGAIHGLVAVEDARVRESVVFAVLAQLVLESAFWSLVSGIKVAERFDLLRAYKLQSINAPPELTKEAVRNVLISHWVIRPVALTVLYYFALFGRAPLITDEPPHARVALHRFLLCMLIDDTYFYWAHRACHTKHLYAAVHKKHHQFHTPNVWATEWAHPIEDIFVNSAGTILGPVVLGLHPILGIMYIATKLYQSMEAHSGYNIPFPFSISSVIDSMDCAPAHDFHHSANVGNFGGFFMFWDWICGTDAAYKRMVMTKKAEAIAYRTARRPYEHDAI